ncbi:hypothetical protein [Mesorhizobium sp.]|uniref:hypothetical protein n=1 Tax=Mesorhizobium sp. TaxID=1871066 RepID=UPI000FE893F4|nr:hypothetical protein [Mesorhizobium sp.]RWQ24209.1 MAG: hypothetical protein EOR93_04645 [Mesorhizobium sp.]
MSSPEGDYDQQDGPQQLFSGTLSGTTRAQRLSKLLKTLDLHWIRFHKCAQIPAKPLYFITFSIDEGARTTHIALVAASGPRKGTKASHGRSSIEAKNSKQLAAARLIASMPSGSRKGAASETVMGEDDVPQSNHKMERGPDTGPVAGSKGDLATCAGHLDRA